MPRVRPRCRDRAVGGSMGPRRPIFEAPAPCWRSACRQSCPGRRFCRVGPVSRSNGPSSRSARRARIHYTHSTPTRKQPDDMKVAASHRMIGPRHRSCRVSTPKSPSISIRSVMITSFLADTTLRKSRFERINQEDFVSSGTSLPNGTTSPLQTLKRGKRSTQAMTRWDAMSSAPAGSCFGRRRGLGVRRPPPPVELLPVSASTQSS